MKNILIDKMNLSVRTKNCMRRAEIYYLDEFMKLTENELYAIPQMGKASVKEVIDMQYAIRQNPDFDPNNLKTADNEELLVINLAFPESIEKQIQVVLYKNNYGLMEQNILIDDIAFSVRIINAFRYADIKTIADVAMMPVAQLKNMARLGEKSINELVEYFRENSKIIYAGEIIDNTVEKLYKAILSEIENESPDFNYSFFSKELKIALNKAKEMLMAGTDDIQCILSSNTMKECVFNSSDIRKAFSNHFVSIISRSNENVKPSRLYNEVPRMFLTENFVTDILSELESARRIECCDDGYRIYLPSIGDWLETLKDSQKRAISLRLQGKTLEECGQIMGITRERVRQIISKAVSRKPILREDDYSYWFRQYDITEEAMLWIFGIGKENYIYLSAIYDKGKVSIDDICDDEHMTSEIYINYQKYINRNSIIIDGEYVPVKRDRLCRRLAQSVCKNNDISFEDFYKKYMNMLEENCLSNNESLLFPSERAFEARMQDSMYTLMKYGRRMRYYEIYEYDIESMVEKLHFEQFNDIEISTLKLVRDNPDLMAEYNIMDEYELHNLLNKTKIIWNRDNKYDVELTRMPFLVFGNADRKKQTEWLLYQVAPVSQLEFGQFYEMEFGVRANTAISNMGKFISHYYHNGYFTVDQPVLTEEEFKFLSDALKGEFYFIEDVKVLYIERFGDLNIAHLNPRAYKELGFKVFSNYIIKNKYLSAEEYFTCLLTKDELTDLNKLDSRFTYISSFNQALYAIRENYDILEYEERKYISYEHFSSVANGISKVDFEHYLDSISEVAKGHEFFTIKLLKNEGFQSELHEIGFEEYFFEALIKNSKRFSCIQTAKAVIFAEKDVQITLFKFIKYLLSSFKKMDIVDFMSYMKEEYGVVIRKEKILYCIQDSDLYYDPIMEKIYFDKEYYYEEF